MSNAKKARLARFEMLLVEEGLAVLDEVWRAVRANGFSDLRKRVEREARDAGIMLT